VSRYAATTAVSVSKSKVEIDAILTRYNVSLKFDGMKRFVAPKTGRCPGHCCALGDE